MEPVHEGDPVAIYANMSAVAHASDLENIDPVSNVYLYE